jgi:hypothetical protein
VAFTAGAGGRLLHAATLLTGDPVEAERLLVAVLARVYADWYRMRTEDPYEQARGELFRRFSYRPWWRRPHGGTLDRLSARERLVVTMRFFEGVAEEQTAAQLGLPTDRVRAIGARATATLRSVPSGRGADPPGNDGKNPTSPKSRAEIRDAPRGSRAGAAPRSAPADTPAGRGRRRAGPAGARRAEPAAAPERARPRGDSTREGEERGVAP